MPKLDASAKRVLDRVRGRVPVIVGVSAPGFAAMRAASDRGDMRRISILAGNGGGLFLPEELARGADVAMTGFGYPAMMVDVCKAHAAGDLEHALPRQRSISDHAEDTAVGMLDQ